LKIFILIFLSLSSLMAEISIEEAWSSVRLKNDGVKAANSDIEIAQLKESSAESMYLPSVTLTGSYTHLSEPIKMEGEIDLSSLPIPLPGAIPYRLDLSEQDVFLADLQLLWPLYTGGKIDAAQDIYAAQADEARAMAQMKKDEEFLKLVKYYYGVVVASSLYETRKEAQKALQLHYENAQKLKNAGQIATIELLNAEVKLDAAKIQTSKARHKLAIARSAFFSQTKQNAAPSSSLFVNENIHEESYYKDQTQENYAGLKILDAKEKESAALVDIKESGWYPQVAAFANYNLYKDDSPMMGTLPTWFAGVMVKIDILQRKDRSQEAQAAKMLNAKVKYLKAEALDNLALLVEKTYKEMLSDKEEFNSLSSSIELSRENYRLRSIAFSEGLSTSVELVDAQMFLLGAKTKRLNAAYNYVKKVSQLCVLSGNRESFFEVVNMSEEIDDEK